MSNETIYDQSLKDDEFERLMAQEDFILAVTEAFSDILESEGIKRNKLAKTTKYSSILRFFNLKKSVII